MAMEINNIYSSNTGSYVNYTDNRKSSESKTKKAGTTKESQEADNNVRKTAADELSYLSKKYSNYSFVAANYTKGMQYGSSSTVNVAISPQFLAKMAGNPELEKEYEENIAAMQECDEQNIRSVEAGGWHVVSQGWVINKDGGISKWSIVQKDDTKSHLQKMSENAEKIRKNNEEKKKAKEEIEERRQASREEKAKLQEEIEEKHKKQFGDKLKSVVIIHKEDEKGVVSKGVNKNNMEAAGANLDMKI